MFWAFACHAEPPSRPPAGSDASSVATADTAPPSPTPTSLTCVGVGSDWFGDGLALGPDYDGDGVRELFFGAPMGMEEEGYATWAPSSLIEQGSRCELGGMVVGPEGLSAELGHGLGADAQHVVITSWDGMYVLGPVPPDFAVARVEDVAVATYRDTSYFGEVSVGPDIDGDGAAEVVLATYGALSVYSVALRGERTFDDRWLGIESGDHFGAPVDYRPPVYDDIDGDGLGDLVFATGQGLDEPASVHLVYSSPAPGEMLVDDADAHLVGGSDADSLLSSAVAPVGDFDGDGTADFAVGSPGLWRTSPRGSVYVWLTHPTGTHPMSEGPVEIRGIVDDRGFGDWLVAAGDADGDGTGDFVGGAYGYAALVGGLGPGAYEVDDIGRQWWRTTGRLEGMPTGDLDRDGFDDFALGWTGGATIYFGPR